MQKVNKETADFNHTTHQMDQIGMFRTFHPATAEDTFLLSVKGTFSKRDHVLSDQNQPPKI